MFNNLELLMSLENYIGLLFIIVILNNNYNYYKLKKLIKEKKNDKNLKVGKE